MPEFSQEIFNEICMRLGEGESLTKICKEESMPAKVNVLRWVRDNEELRNQYVRAREDQADSLADECIDIADDCVNDWVEKKDGGKEFSGDHVMRAKLRIEARKWTASKLRPKKYGEASIMRVQGDDEKPLVHKIERVIVGGKKKK